MHHYPDLSILPCLDASVRFLSTRQSYLAVAFVFAGSAAAGIRRLKLEKDPFDRQLTTLNVQDHTRALARKYDHKFLSIDHKEACSAGLTAPDRDHVLPIENFLNAECMDILVPLLSPTSLS